MGKAVIFDMDGVLVDNGEYHFKAWARFCEKYGILFSEEEFRTKYFGQANDNVLTGLMGKELSASEMNGLADEKEQMYREIYAPDICPVNGLTAFIDELKKANIRIGVATSAPKANVDFVTDALGIKDKIDVIVYDSMVSNSKPHPEIYLKTAELLQMKPSDCIVFEDSLSGTKSAFDAGARVIAITTTLPPEQHRYAHQTIKDFSEPGLKEMLF